MCDFTDLVRARDGIGRAHVGHDLDSIGRTHAEHRLHPIDQQRIVAERSIAHLRLLRDGDRALGQALEDEVLNAAAFRQLDGRLNAVAGIACACSDSDAFHRPSHADRARYYSGKIPITTQVTVMTIDARNRNPNVYF